MPILWTLPFVQDDGGSDVIEEGEEKGDVGVSLSNNFMLAMFMHCFRSSMCIRISCTI